MIDPTRQSIRSLFKYFQTQPDALYTWVESSEERKRICKGRLVRAAFLQYDICCPLIFTLFQEQGAKVEKNEGIKPFLIDLKRGLPSVFLCEVYSDFKLVHAFLLQCIGLECFLYQSHPNHYNLYDSLDNLDKTAVDYDHFKNNLTYLDAKMKHYVQTSSKQLFHFPIAIGNCGNVALRYKKCSYKAIENIALPLAPSTSPMLLILLLAAFVLGLAIHGSITKRYNIV